MFNGKISKPWLHAALLALAFGPLAVQAQSAKSPTGSASEGSVVKSPTTPTGASPSGADSGASGTSGSSGTSSGSSASDSSGSSVTGSSATGSAAESKGSVSAADQRFMRDLAQANIAEIEAGKLAQSKSQNDEVKNFAQRMIDDHGKALQDLQQLAQSKGVTLPTRPDAKHLAMAKTLSALSGDQFDRRYMAQGGLADHKRTHQLLQRVQSRATDPDLKQAAAQMLPVVDQHLNMAQQTQASLKTSTGSATGASGSAGTTSSGAGGKVESSTGGAVGSGSSK
jgi:putative membrane protein